MHEQTLKFSKGPWSYHTDYSRRITTDDEMPLARVYVRGTRTDANGHLMAAAPELYDALERFWREANSGIIEGGTLDSAAAALAKARGDRGCD